MLGLVVEGDVSTDYGHLEREAGIGQAEYRPIELPGDVGLLRVAEVEAVGEAEGLGADAGEILGALEHRLDRAGIGIAGDPPPVAIDRHRDRPVGLREHEHGGVGGLRPARGA